MIDAVGDAGADDAEFIGHLCGVRQPVGDPQPALTMLLPLALVGEQRSAAFAHRGDDGAEAVRQGLPLEFSQQRLGVKKIELAGAAFHEEEDHAFRLAHLVREPGRLRHARLS